jgi:hypothetical protein
LPSFGRLFGGLAHAAGLRVLLAFAGSGLVILFHAFAGERRDIFTGAAALIDRLAAGRIGAAAIIVELVLLLLVLLLLLAVLLTAAALLGSVLLLGLPGSAALAVVLLILHVFILFLFAR